MPHTHTHEEIAENAVKEYNDFFDNAGEVGEMDLQEIIEDALLLYRSNLIALVKERANDLVLHTPLELSQTSGRDYDKGYIDYQDMVNRQIEEFFKFLDNLEQKK